MAILVRNPSPDTEDARDTELIPGLGISMEGHGNPTQYSCLSSDGQREEVGGLESIGVTQSWALAESNLALTCSYYRNSLLF